jgi:nucleoside-diphosphate-sugar epimerase
MNKGLQVLVTGGAGYVGSALVPLLLEQGHRVKVLDLYLFGDHVLDGVKDHPNLTQIKGDLRDPPTVDQAVSGCDAVIHLACISNDPSFELDPALGKSINYDCFPGLVRSAQNAGVRRFIYASSSSVYGIKEEPNVTEDLPLTPLTDYSKFKAMCEEVLLHEQRPGFTVLVLRPATVCGYAPRLRLDLSTTPSRNAKSPFSAAIRNAPTSTSPTSVTSTSSRCNGRIRRSTAKSITPVGTI